MKQEDLRATALKYLKFWSCISVGEPYFTSSSLLWPATRLGENVILKIVDPLDDEAHSATALEFFEGHGAVMVRESTQNILLLERILQAEDSSLEQMVLSGRDDEATRIICEVTEKLHSASETKAAPPEAIPFLQRTSSLRSAHEERQVDLRDRSIFRLANEVLEDLLQQSSGSEIFLHGDIHHFNILKSSDRGWLAIDPKGIRGPKIYDYANTLCNPYMHESVVANSSRMERQSYFISEFANVDRDLLIQFTFLHAMIAASWNLNEPDLPYWLACARTAAELGSLKVD